MMSRSWARTEVPKSPQLCFSATAQPKGSVNSRWQNDTLRLFSWPKNNPKMNTHSLPTAKAQNLEIYKCYFFFSMVSCFRNTLTSNVEAISDKGLRNARLAGIYQWCESVAVVFSAHKAQDFLPHAAPGLNNTKTFTEPNFISVVCTSLLCGSLFRANNCWFLA